MKIILVGTCLGVGGAERVMVDLADAYVARGHQVRLVALTGPILLRPSNPNVGIVCLNARGTIDVLAAAWRFRQEIADFRPDVVHAHLFHAIVLTRLLRFVIYLPKLVTTVHSTRVGGFFRRLAYRSTERLSDISTSVSEEVARQFLDQKAAGSRPLQVLYNGISLEQFQRMENAHFELAKEFGLDEKTKLIVSVGRLEAAKDYPNLLCALSLLKDRGIPFLAVVVGEGSLRDSLEGQARSLGLANRVRFLGIRRDICRLLSAADVFVLSSAWEGLPMAVGEAMACECTVVATDCGGVRELVADAGFLVPAKNFQLLAESLDKALSLSTEERRRFGVKAQERVQKRFSLDASVTRWLEIYAHRK